MPILDIKILPFQQDDQEAVKELILAGLVEHWGFLDETKNSDLNDIAKSYKTAWRNNTLISI